MAVTHAPEMPNWIKTNLVWIAVVNIALIILYVSVSYKLHTSNLNQSNYYIANIIPLKSKSNESTEDILDKPTVNTAVAKVFSNDCAELVFPAHLSPEVTWRPVERNRSAFVFSVYFVKNYRKLVIIGAKERNRSVFHCQLWYKGKDKVSFTMKQRNAKVIVLPEGHGRRYTSTLFECLLTSSTLPTYVSLVRESCAMPLNLLTVHPGPEPGSAKRRFTVCLTPLNFRYSDDHGLVEWIELNRILGAEKFIVYNYSSAINVKNILQYYSKRGITEVVQWRLPMNVDTNPAGDKPAEIHYFGQIAALQDCLYRSKLHSEFIVNTDLDEFIIPHAYNVLTWSDIVTQLYQMKKKAAAAYLFRNTFFRKEWANTDILVYNKTVVKKYRLVTLQKFEHENKVFPPTVRSKYFARTSKVSSVMIHGIRGFSFSKLLVVPPSVGVLHHYRNCEDLSAPSDRRVVDKTVMDKYGASLLNNVQNIWSEIGDSGSK